MTGNNVRQAGLPPLREADWRFLFARRDAFDFRNLIVSGGPPGLCERLVDAGVACSVTSRLEPGTAASAVILLPGTMVDPLDALDWLPPGTPLYVELDGAAATPWSRLWATPFGLKRKLERAGAEIKGVFLIAGDPSGSTRYVQLDSPETVHWYVENMVSGASRGQLALQRLAASLPGVASRLPWHIASRFAVVATKPKVRSRADESAPSVPPETVIQVTSGVDDGSRIVTLGFPAGACAPAWVRKTSRQASFNEQVHSEHRALTFLRQRLHPVTGRAVPCALGIERHGALVSGTETAAQGASILDLAWRRNRSMREKVDDLRLATSWLIDAHRQLQSPAPVDASAWLREALTLPEDGPCGPIPRLQGVRRVVERARAGVEKLSGLAMPLTVLHRDFGPWNVLRNGHDLTVIDWENCRPDDPEAVGPGLCDLLHFALHWSFAARGLHGSQDQAAGLLDLVDGSSRDAHDVAARREISRYMREMTLDGRLLGPLLVLTLKEHAFERERREALAGRTAERTDKSHFVTLLDALDAPAAHPLRW